MRGGWNNWTCTSARPEILIVPEETCGAGANASSPLRNPNRTPYPSYARTLVIVLIPETSILTNGCSANDSNGSPEVP